MLPSHRAAPTCWWATCLEAFEEAVRHNFKVFNFKARRQAEVHAILDELLGLLHSWGLSVFIKVTPGTEVAGKAAARETEDSDRHSAGLHVGQIHLDLHAAQACAVRT
jgi:hypothetical protein